MNKKHLFTTAICTLVLTSSMAFAQLNGDSDYTVLGDGWDFVAPVVSDSADAPSRVGQVIFNSTTDTFMGRGLSGWQDLTPGAATYLSATSSVKTPGTTGDYLAMTNGAVTLTPGEWMLTGQVDFGNNGSSAAYTQVQVQWASSPGADSGTSPGILPTDAGYAQVYTPFATAIGGIIVNSPIVRVTVASNTTVYLVPRANLSTPSNGRITTYIWAEQIGEN